MIQYKASYRGSDGTVLAEVLDFPGAVSFGATLDEARTALAGALQDLAEALILEGKALPVPDPAKSSPESDVEEAIVLDLRARALAVA